MATEYPRSPSAPPEPYTPPPPRRLARSSRERMWAGVAGGLAEYFDLDPALVRLMWVAATIISAGLAIPVYILAWIILPRDDRHAYGTPPQGWRDWSQEPFGERSRPVAEETPRAPTGVPASGPAGSEPGVNPAPADWWRSDQYTAPYADRHRGRHPRSAGMVLIVLGALLLAANAGLFNFVEWRMIWPIVFIGLGVVLLARQSGWNR